MAEGVKGVGDFKGATAQATEDLKANNPGLALTAALREMQAAFAPALMPIVEIINNSVIPAVKSMAEWFANLTPGSQKNSAGYRGNSSCNRSVIADLRPYRFGCWQYSGGFGSPKCCYGWGATGIAILTTAFPALGTAFAVITGPIGLTIAGIALLVAGGVALYKNWGYHQGQGK